MTGPLICPPEHRHGTTGTCYHHHHCRCEPCRTGVSVRVKQQKKLKAYGRYVSPWVPAGPTRAHIDMLRSYGLGYKTIALRAGVHPTGVRTLIYGREDYIGSEHGPRHGERIERIGREKAAKILAVQPTLDILPGAVLVPARATVRRLKALVAFGYSMTVLATELGMSISNFGRIILRYDQANRDRNSITVQASTARAVIALYDRLSVIPPRADDHRSRISVSRSRRYAADRGWPDPWDWEAYDNDFDRPAPVRRAAA